MSHRVLPTVVAPAVVVAAALTLLPAGSATAQTGPPPVDGARVAESVRDIDLQVIDITASVRDLEVTSTQGSETVVSLSTDVLFEFGEAVLPAAAPAKLTELTARVPRGGALKVHGFTDGIGGPESNLALSRARAEAVAAAVRATRSDLTLDVQGFGESRPVAPNDVAGKDNPEGRAQNRRVEFRFTG